MKRFIITIITLGMNVSCIYDYPYDKFYRTIWKSSESQFDNFYLEFLCGERISAQANGAIGSYGLYESDRMNVWFEGLTLTYSTQTVTIVSAQRKGDTLHLTWHNDIDPDTRITEMYRLRQKPEQ